MALIFVINGPNLNLLGSREPAHYGHDTLETIEQRLTDMATGFGHQLEIIHHNDRVLRIHLHLVHIAGLAIHAQDTQRTRIVSEFHERRLAA